MKKILPILLTIFLMSGICFAEWDITKPVDSELIPSGPGVIRTNFEALDDALMDFRDQIIQYNSASQLTLTAGGMACSDGSTTKYRGNTSSTTVTWSDIDTGAEANATYYVYANCDAAATTNTFKISLSSTAPSGVTHYQRIGYFTNTGGDIVEGSVTNDKDGAKLSIGLGTGTISDSGTIPLPSGFSESQCTWTLSLDGGSQTTSSGLGISYNLAAASRTISCSANDVGFGAAAAAITCRYLIICTK